MHFHSYDTPGIFRDIFPTSSTIKPAFRDKLSVYFDIFINSTHNSPSMRINYHIQKRGLPMLRSKSKVVGNLNARM